MKIISLLFTLICIVAVALALAVQHLMVVAQIKEPYWIEVTINDVTEAHTGHTIVLDNFGRALRLTGEDWGERGDSFYVNVHGEYFQDAYNEPVNPMLVEF